MAKINHGGAAREGVPARLRHHHRHRRGAQHGEGQPGCHRGGVRPRRHRPVGGAGRGHGQGRPHHRHRHQPGRSSRWRKLLGATDCINPKDYDDTPIQQVIVEMTDGGVDYSLRVHRQRARDARGAGVLPQGLGRVDHHRRRRRRRRRSARGRSSWSPAASGAARPSAGSRAARSCPVTSTATCTARSGSTR